MNSGVKGPFTLSIQHGGGAEKGGLQMDDRIIEVNGVNIEDCTHFQVAKKVRWYWGIHSILPAPSLMM